MSLLVSADLSAHQDSLITLEGVNLVGLPAEYQPAELDLERYRLRIKNHVMDFSPFVKSLFPEKRDYDFIISSSWYHDRSVLSPYISIHIKPKTRDFSYRILFNMESLSVIEVSVVLTESDNVTRELPINLSVDRKRDIEKSIREVSGQK